jgi:DNA-binding MarR family transcriptional regulator
LDTSTKFKARSVEDGRTALSHGVLDELVGFHLRRAQVALFQHFSRSIAPHDLTPGQFGILCLIEANPGLSQMDLVHELGVDRSTIVAVIDRLAARGLVERRPSSTDRRRNVVALTADGRSLWRKLTRLVRRHEQVVTRGLGAAGQRQLIALLGRLGR